MDLTQLFKASVKTVRLRNKSASSTDKTRILRNKCRDEFSIKANDIRYQIKQLRDLLIENRAGEMKKSFFCYNKLINFPSSFYSLAYMRFGIHLKSSTHMTDEERNIIDEESEKIILLCNKYLNDLKVECLKDKVRSKRQAVEHQLAIIDILSSFLSDISRIHKEQKENRIQHELETYKLLKLESNVSATYHQHVNKKSNPEVLQQRKKNQLELDKEPNVKNNNTRSLNKSQSDVAIDEDQEDKFTTSCMSSDDIQMLESENIQLLNDIKGLSEEVEQIEKNVVGIAKLQEIFTEKVQLLGTAFLF